MDNDTWYRDAWENVLFFKNFNYISWPVRFNTFLHFLNDKKFFSHLPPLRGTTSRYKPRRSCWFLCSCCAVHAVPSFVPIDMGTVSTCQPTESRWFATSPLLPGPTPFLKSCCGSGLGAALQVSTGPALVTDEVIVPHVHQITCSGCFQVVAHINKIRPSPT